MSKWEFSPKKYAVQSAEAHTEFSGLKMGFKTFSETFALPIENEFAQRLIHSYNACEGINRYDPAQVAETIKQAFELLRFISDYNSITLDEFNVKYPNYSAMGSQDFAKHVCGKSKEIIEKSGVIKQPF